MNWTEELIKNGFEAFGVSFGTCIGDNKYKNPSFSLYKRHDYNPDLNYFGASLYSPDVILTKDNNEVIISLQGVMSKPNNSIELIPFWEKRIVKYISVTKDNKSLFETWTGEIPPKAIISQLL